MDRIITALLVVAVVAFFVWLNEQRDKTEWVAIVDMGNAAHEAGRFDSYDECVAGVLAKVDVSTTPYSCTRH